MSTVEHSLFPLQPDVAQPTAPKALLPPRVPGAWATRPLVASRPIRRFFVVGCPRSGTTLVQARLAPLGGLMTLPETHFFPQLLDGEVGHAGRGWSSRLLLARRRTHERLSAALQSLLQGRPLRHHLSGRGYVKEFFALLDAAAAAQAASGWLEKTPQHYEYIDLIRSLCPDACFIHVLRAGEDVVASAVEAEMHYANSRAFSGGVAHWVATWNRAAETHLRYAGTPGHHVITHEDLVRDVDSALGRLLDFAALDAHRDGRVPVERIADLRTEPWKRDAVDGRIAPPARKFEALFGPQAQAWIRSRLIDYRALCAEIARRQH